MTKNHDDQNLGAETWRKIMAILWMVANSCTTFHRWFLPLFFRVSTIQGGAGFLPSTVSYRLSPINGRYQWEISPYIGLIYGRYLQFRDLKSHLKISINFSMMIKGFLTTWLRLHRIFFSKFQLQVSASNLRLCHLGGTTNRDFWGCYPLVNVYIMNWKITMLFMGKLTIDGHFQ